MYDIIKNMLLEMRHGQVLEAGLDERLERALRSLRHNPQDVDAIAEALPLVIRRGENISRHLTPEQALEALRAALEDSAMRSRTPIIQQLAIHGLSNMAPPNFPDDIVDMLDAHSPETLDIVFPHHAAIEELNDLLASDEASQHVPRVIALLRLIDTRGDIRDDFNAGELGNLFAELEFEGRYHDYLQLLETLREIDPGYAGYFDQTEVTNEVFDRILASDDPERNAIGYMTISPVEENIAPRLREHAPFTMLLLRLVSEGRLRRPRILLPERIFLQLYQHKGSADRYRNLTGVNLNLASPILLEGAPYADSLWKVLRGLDDQLPRLSGLTIVRRAKQPEPATIGRFLRLMSWKLEWGTPAKAEWQELECTLAFGADLRRTPFAPVFRVLGKTKNADATKLLKTYNMDGDSWHASDVLNLIEGLKRRHEAR